MGDQSVTERRDFRNDCPDDSAVRRAAVALLVRNGDVLFVTEMAVQLDSLGVNGLTLASTIRSLERTGQVVVVEHVADDACCDGVDLRMVSLVSNGEPHSLRSAYGRADLAWGAFLQELYASHRCG